MCYGFMGTYPHYISIKCMTLTLQRPEKRESEETVLEGWSDTTIKGGRKNFPALKVPRQSPPFLLAEVLLREG
jgi:hypothetical protein